MTAIKKIENDSGNQVFPITHERAVRDDNGVTLEAKLQNINSAIDTTIPNHFTQVDDSIEQLLAANTELRTTVNNLVGISNDNFMGIFQTVNNLPTMTAPGWALVGTSLSSLLLYTYTSVSNAWTKYSDETYDFTDYSGLVAQVAQIGSNLDQLDNKFQTLSLGIDQDDGLLYIYVNGVKTGDGVDVSGGQSGTRYTITYNLSTHLSSSNRLASILEGRPYNTVITSDNPNYQIDSASVTMGGIDVTSSVYADGTITIPSVTGAIVITVTAVFFASVVLENPYISVKSGGTSMLGVKLDAQPLQSQTVSIRGDNLTVSPSSLTFTTENWNTYQNVTITAGNFYTTEYGSVIVKNSDLLMTESTAVVEIQPMSYEDCVDTTIPSGAHTIEAADFNEAQVTGNSVILRTYQGTYDNIIVPQYISVDGGNKKVRLPNSKAFKNNTTLKYVTIEDGVSVSEYGTSDTAANWKGLFENCTSLIGVKYVGTNISNLANTFKGCTSLKFFDGLDKQVAVTTLQSAFQNCSSLEYIQDLSNLTAVGNLQSAFQACGNLIHIFGMMPSCNGSTVTMNSAFYDCGKLTSAVIPLNVTDLFYTFNNCTSLRKIECLATAAFTRTGSAFNGCTNLYVYCVPESEAYNKLLTDYGSSSQVHIVEKGKTELPNIVVWGDSTSSPNTSWGEWPKRLIDKLSGFLLKNQAVSGEFTTSTSARQGGNVISVEAFEIPATTDRVAVTAKTADGQTFGSSPVFSGGGGFNPCHIGNVEGYLTSTGGVVYFNRKTSGTAVSVSADTPVISDNDNYFNNADAVMLILLGVNNGWDNIPAKLVNQMKLMVQHFTAKGGTKYIISGPWAGVFLRSAAGVANIQAFEALAAEEFGNHFFSLRQYLIDNGLTQNNLVASETDIDRMEIGQVPGSLLGGGTTTNILMYPSTSSDETHPNAYGANSISEAFYEKGVALGYWT